MTHLKDTTKPRGIHCNRWNQGFLFITENPAIVDCKTCKGERAANRVLTIVPDATDIGKILHDSWGYNMTLVDFCKIIGITEKKVKCRMVGRCIENDNGRGDGKAWAGSTEYGPVFLLSKTQHGFKGSYPYCASENPNDRANESRRMGYFTETKVGEKHYYNTWD